MSGTKRIKECPFCGRKGNKIISVYQYGHNYVECMACWARGPCVDHDSEDKPEARAIAKWNGRS